MYNEELDGVNAQEHQVEDVFSKPVRAGKRTYFFDVKATRGNDYYLTITESKRKVDKDGHYAYDKHKIFLYKEDFEKFTDSLKEVIDYIKTNCPLEAAPQPKPQDGQNEQNSYSDVDFDEL